MGTLEFPELPQKHRRRWLKRILVYVPISLILAIALTRIFYGFWADNQLDSELASLRARGEPISVSDLKIPMIADEQNGAWYYQRAMTAIKKPDDISNAWQGWDGDWNPQLISDLSTLVADETEAISLAHQAMPHPVAVWNIDWSAPALTSNLPSLTPLRSLANLVSSDAFLAHTHGNDARALQDMLNLRHQADAIEQYYPSLVTHLVAVGINALASDGTIHLSQDLHLSSAPPTREAAEKLVASLLDDHAAMQGAQTCWFGERQMALNAVPITPNSTAKKLPPLFICIRPVFVADVARILQIDDQAEAALKEPTWPAAKAKLPDLTAKYQGGVIHTATHLLSKLLVPSLNRFTETHFRGLTERRTAALALAIALYRYDHNGSWPQTLDELVPKYLPAVPVDPFSPIAATMRYIPPAQSGPIIYSVGSNGVDDGGSEQPLNPNPTILRQSQWDMLDIVFHLTPQPKPATAPDAESQ